jgi:2-polyprenyl-3-methyl-5-hydroxy-6-metoxy-1,4-benzoquinol methylase
MISRSIGQDLELLYTVKKMPVKCSVSDLNTPVTDDVRMDMDFYINNKGLIHINPLPPISLLYETFHNDSLGNTWEKHHIAFSDLIKKYCPKKVMEIGGGSGILSKIYRKQRGEVSWTIFDINTAALKDRQDIHVLEGDVSDLHEIPKDYDVVVHSHLFEHLYNPEEFLNRLSHATCKGTIQIFSIPNLKVYLKKGYLNSLFFEHNIYYDEAIIKEMLEENGFRLDLIQYHEEHSVFYVCTNIKEYCSITKSNRYHELKKVFLDYISGIKEFVDECVSRSPSSVYIYGAHIFSQILLEFGLDKLNIKGVLDNSNLKIGKRLYGYDFEVFSPSVLQKEKNPTLIIRAGAYQQEIKDEILAINPNTTILE